MIIYWGVGTVEREGLATSPVGLGLLDSPKVMVKLPFAKRKKKEISRRQVFTITERFHPHKDKHNLPARRRKKRGEGGGYSLFTNPQDYRKMPSPTTVQYTNQARMGSSLVVP